MSILTRALEVFRSGNGDSGSSTSVLREELSRAALTIELLDESIRDLERDNVGWMPIGVDPSQRDFNRSYLNQIIDRSRISYLYHPLINRSIQVQALYVWGQGVSIKAKDSDVDAVIQALLNDPSNQTELTSHQALDGKETDLAVDGNLFFTFFKHPRTGHLRIRTIPPEQIEDIITNPEDKREVWYYKRVRNERRFDLQTGRYSVSNNVTEYYPDWRYNAVHPPTIGGNDVVDIPVYHVKVGGLGGMQFGVPELYAAFDWNKADATFRQDFASVARTLQKYAMELEVKGGKSAIASAKAKIASITRNTSTGSGVATPLPENPAPTAGSTFIRGSDTKLDPVKVSGATLNLGDVRYYLLMVAAAAGIPECYDEQTEVLTDHGFMLHKDWKPGIKVACFNPDTSLTEWHEPNDLRSYYYNGDMIRFKNMQTDILVTPNHRMWISPNVQWKPLAVGGDRSQGGRKRMADGGSAQVDRSWRIETAEHVETSQRESGWKFSSAVQFDEPETADTVLTPVGEVDAIAWAKFLGYWISEGHASEAVSKSGETRVDGTDILRTYRVIGLTQNDGPILDDMIEVLRELGIHHYEYNTHDNCYVLNIWNKDLWSYLRSECGVSSEFKRIPQWLMEAPINQRRAVFSALMSGDGDVSGGSFRYTTKSKVLADQMQLLAVSLGYGSSVALEESLYRYNGTERKNEIWRVYIRTQITDTSILKPKHISREQYTGMVYCFNVPHGIYVTRRNGKIAVQGNTFYGDASVGNYATSKTLDRPTELKFKHRQTLWTDIIRDICDYAIDMSVLSPNGHLRSRGKQEIDPITGEMRVILDDDGDRSVSIDFPPILEHDMTARVEAIIAAATLKGQEPIGTMDHRTMIRMLLMALGVSDIDALLNVLAPDGGESLIDRLKAEKQAMARQIAQTTVPITDPNISPEDDDEEEEET